VTALLEARDVSVRFGGVHALQGLDLEVGEGQLVGLIGPNGAGKTTFVDAISGFVRYSGNVALDGQDLAGMAPHVRARRGLSRTWQSTELFDDLSIRENLSVEACEYYVE
jgi:branched-chain amino acid transport system ATP-binding protein